MVRCNVCLEVCKPISTSTKVETPPTTSSTTTATTPPPPPPHVNSTARSSPPTVQEILDDFVRDFSNVGLAQNPNINNTARLSNTNTTNVQVQNGGGNSENDGDNSGASAPSDGESEVKPGHWTCPTNLHHTCCLQCITLYTQTRLGDGVITVPCPGDFIDCAYMLNLKELEPILPEETFQKLKTMTDLATNAKARECPKCSKISIGSASKPKMSCSECDMEFCFFHGADHVGQPCSMPDTTLIQKLKNKAWRWKNSKTCPQCHQAIQKDGGCQHVTCRCGYEMCWNCGGAWARNGRKGHLRTLFPPPSKLKHCCNTFRLWGARVAIVTGIVIVFPIGGPICLIYYSWSRVGRFIGRKRKSFKAWKERRRERRKKSRMTTPTRSVNDTIGEGTPVGFDTHRFRER